MRLSLVLFAAIAVASECMEATIPSALAVITADLLSLNQSLAAFTGSADDSLSYILRNSTALLNDLKAGTNIARDAPRVIFPNALVLVDPTSVLVQDSNDTINTLIATKPKFDNIQATSIVLSTIQDLQSATNNFSDAVIGKLPLEVAPVGAQLVSFITDQFATAIKIYS